MRQPDDAGRLQDMLEAASDAVAIAEGRGRSDLETDRVFALAIERLLEIMGEAAGRLSTGFRDRHPDIPWKAIVGLRNRLIHAYRDVDHDVIWQIVAVDLPRLIPQLNDLRHTLSNST